MDPARLKKIPVFADLSEAELGHIAALAAEVSVPESKELVREGDYSYDVLAIEEGTARVERGAPRSRCGVRHRSGRRLPPSSRRLQNQRKPRLRRLRWSSDQRPQS